MQCTLTIDLPKCCFTCPCYYWELYNCNAAKREVSDSTVEVEGRPNWCPLQKIPDLSDVDVTPINEHDQKALENAAMAIQILRYYNDHPEELAGLLKEIEDGNS